MLRGSCSIPGDVWAPERLLGQCRAPDDQGSGRPALHLPCVAGRGPCGALGFEAGQSWAETLSTTCSSAQRRPGCGPQGRTKAAEAREVFPLKVQGSRTTEEGAVCSSGRCGSEPVVVVVYSTRGGSSDGPGLAATGACLLYALSTMSGRSTARASQAQTPLPAPSRPEPFISRVSSSRQKAHLTSTKVFCTRSLHLN